MNPYRDETTEQLIARRPERLNILITAAIGSIEMRRAWYSVLVRYGYSPISGDGSDVGGRRSHVAVPMLPDIWDPDALSRAGNAGAFREVPDVEGVRQAVRTLRDAWGPLHVQDNSGLVPDLHQGMFRG